MAMKNRQKELDTFIEYCLEKRLEQLETNSSDEKYQALLERNYDLIDKLSEDLPENLEKDLREYCTCNCELTSYIEAYFYKCGFMDAVKLAKTIKEL